LKKSPPPEPSEQDSLYQPVVKDSLHDPLQMGITIVGVTVVFGAAGWWIDRRLHTFPIFLILGAIVGLSGIIYATAKRLRESDSPNEEKKSEPTQRKGK
jgi:F0F1-type ATP synthase assembly protein I